MFCGDGLLVVAVILGLCEGARIGRKNVCRTFRDYQTIHQANPNCWYDPDVGANAAEVSSRYGYPFESHEVTTPDGYILSLYRIPHNGSDVNRKRPPVLLQHGIAVQSVSWMMLKKNSLAFFLADNGFDVWLANARGTEPSAKHTKYSIHDPRYWGFSFHELGVFDLPTMIDFIASKTKQRGQLRFIGHSMGITSALVYASVNKTHAQENLKSITALAPVAYLHDTPLPVTALVPIRNEIYEILKAIGLSGVGPNIQFKLDLIHFLCGQYPFIVLCSFLTASGAGLNVNEIIIERLPVGFSHYPSGFSMKSILHYAQIIDARRFQFFDNGASENLRLYNSVNPPEYPIADIKIPIHVFYGKRDVLADESDVLRLYNQLTTEKTIQEVFSFGHNDFLAGRSAIKLYRMILKYL